MQNKTEERAYLNRFADALGTLWLKKANDFEAPDFVLPAGSGILGVEFAKWFIDRGNRGSPTKRAESLLDDLCEHAKGSLQRLFPEIGLAVKICPRVARVSGSKRDIRQASDQLVSAVANALPTLPQGRFFEKIWPSELGSDDRELPLFANELLVRFTPGMREL